MPRDSTRRTGPDMGVHPPRRPRGTHWAQGVNGAVMHTWAVRPKK
ncbi:hypothetical protein [Tsukamurella sp. 1534]|nr:hypothetical protein [Tsukamurella sp. 1534]